MAKRILGGMLGVTALAGSAIAANYNWVGNLTADFMNAGNWSPSGGPPSTSDNVDIYSRVADETPSWPVLSQDRTIADLTIGQSVALDPPQLTLNGAGVDLTVADMVVSESNRAVSFTLIGPGLLHADTVSFGNASYAVTVTVSSSGTVVTY